MAESPRPLKLWKALTDEQRLAAATAFWSDQHAGVEQAEVLGLVARQINFRLKSVQALPTERKARLLARSSQVSDLVAARLLVAYHLAHQRPLMKAFLDAIGVAHDDGLIAEDVQAPDPDRLRGAARDLFQEFPEPDVRLYFDTLLLQDPDTWGPLQQVLQERD
jgi:hypothetical protein